MKKKSKIPYIFFIFFATFITADIFLIYLANKTWRGTVTENSYEKGRKYNKTLLNNKKQQGLGWQADLNYQSAKNKEGYIYLNLKDKKGLIIKNAQVAVKFVRPTQTGFDFQDQLYFSNQDQRYYQKIIFPLPGLWKVEIQAKVENKIFQYVKRIVIE